MPQYDFGTIDPDIVGGTDLAAMLNQHRDALKSQHKGATRPGYAVAGTQWLDDSATPWLIKRYTGSTDVVEFEIDATSGWGRPRLRQPVAVQAANYTVTLADLGRVVAVDAGGGARTITLPTIADAGHGFAVTIVKTDGSANPVTVQRAGSDTLGGAAATSLDLVSRDQGIELRANAGTGNWVRFGALVLPAAPTFTGLTTVAGVKPATGFLSGTLTMAAHSGGVFMTSGNIVCPNEIGFNATLIAGGAHSVRVATGPTRNLAAGDMFTLAIPAAGVVRAVHTLAANVISMAVG